MWPLKKKDKNLVLKNCLGMSRRNLVDVGKDLITDKPPDMKVDIARIRIARFIHAIDLVLESLK